MSGLCEHCIEGHTLEGTPSGSFEGSAYYHPGPNNSNGDNPSETAVVVLTDIFGLNLVNPKLLTDEYSKRLGCDVWCPDYFAGSPPVTVASLGPHIPDVPGTKSSFLHKLRFIWVVIKALPGFIANRPGVVDKRNIEFITRLKREKGYKKIGAIGFCYGGSVVVRLGSAGVLDSGVIAHPGNISRAQIQAIDFPSSWICAEEDFALGPELRNDAEAMLKRNKEEGKGHDYEFRDYKGTTHGFAARPNLALPEIKQAFTDAVDQAVAWFEKTLN